MNYRIVLFITCLCLLFSCSESKQDKRLTNIKEILSESPREAMSYLDSINYNDLSDADRHYYDFLLIKARDKSYVMHTSDSLILDLVSFYEGSNLFPEILYYAGRTYSDLGDYPRALEFFQSGLIQISENTSESIHLKGNILSQTARLLNNLRLYNQAIPYLKEAIEIDSIEADTFNLAYDNQLLGAVYLHLNNLSDAEDRFIKASMYAQHLSSRDIAHMQMYRAATKLRQQDIDSALSLIKGIPQKVRPIQQNVAYAYASDIYLSAGLTDSAYYYADKLIHSSSFNNRKNGYRNLFSKDLYNLIPKDSIQIYINDYYTTLESYYDSHEAQQALIQNAFYNYQIHQRERIRAEKRNSQFAYIIGILFIFVLVFIIVILFQRYKKRTLLFSLQSAVIELEDLRKSLSERTLLASENIESQNNRQSLSELEVLKRRLQEQINHLMSESARRTPINPIILNSEVYRTINNCILNNKTIPENSSIWTDLEQTIISCSPLFKERLQLLVGQDFKPHDYQVVLLIRCGITPTQMTILLGRTKGTISYRRKHVCEMVLGEKIGSQFIDDIIRYI